MDVIKTWPGSSSLFAENTPTIIAYNTNPPTWGWNVRPRDELVVSNFILGLQRNVGAHYLIPPLHNPPSALQFLDPNWRHPRLPEKTAVDYAADYLTCVHRYVREVFFPSRFGKEFLQTRQISYVITVPSVWENSAKALTRQAAVRAGIPERKLELITEPEAAAWYCAAVCPDSYGPS